MLHKNKASEWKADGMRGRRISKKQCRKLERREERKIIKDIKEEKEGEML